MEKVKLTQEQADIVERVKKEQLEHLKEIKHRSVILQDWEKPLFKLSAEDIQKALFDGYEVEPEFKVGDWVITGRGLLGKYLEKTSEVYRFTLIGGHHATSDNIRHATPEEVAKEKERIWWKRHGREPWEIKQGDVLMATRRHIFEVTADPKSHEFNCYTGNDEFDFSIKECKDENWKVICFAEDRKDIS